MYRENRHINPNYVRHGQHPLRESPIRSSYTGAAASHHISPEKLSYNRGSCERLDATGSRLQAEQRLSGQRRSYAGNPSKSPLREFEINRERRQRFRDSRLATEVALLKYNTPFEKREHSPTIYTYAAGKTASTAVDTNYRHSSAIGYSQQQRASQSPVRDFNCSCRKRSPLQQSAYSRHPTVPGYPDASSCMGGHRHQTKSNTRHSLVESQSQANIETRVRYSAVGDKYSPAAQRSSCQRYGNSPLRQRVHHIEQDYLHEKLQMRIDERDQRIAMLEAQAREERLRFAARNSTNHQNERPLRDSRSRSHGGCAGERPKQNGLYENVFQTVEEKEAALRRRQVISDTQAKDKRVTPIPIHEAVDKDTEWLNQVSSNDQRSNSNSDQIGLSKLTQQQPPAPKVEQSAKSKKTAGHGDSLVYSESEQLQFSQPPRESLGLGQGELISPLMEAEPQIEDDNSPEDEQYEGEGQDMEAEGQYGFGEHSQKKELEAIHYNMEGQLVQHSISVDPDEAKKVKKIRKKMRKQIVQQPVDRDRYADRKQEKVDFIQQIQDNLRELAGDPKQMKKMANMTEKQIKLMKDEQLRQIYDEREVLKTQAEEVKRLEWLNKKLNHSYGLKNRHHTPDGDRRGRSKSAPKRVFVKNGPYQDWTNTFKRSTLHWDDKNALLEQEKTKVKSVKELEKYPARCCGNSPGKQHTHYCKFDQPGSSSNATTWMTSTCAAKKTMTVSKRGKSKAKKGRLINSAARSHVNKRASIPARQTSSATGTRKAQRVAAPKKRLQATGTTDERRLSSENQILYNIDSNGHAIMVHGSPNAAAGVIHQYTEEDKRRLFVDHDDSAKVAAIAQKIKELTEATDDPAVRDRVLSESKVKFNNQIMSIKDFLALCGQVPHQQQQQELQQQEQQEQQQEQMQYQHYIAGQGGATEYMDAEEMEGYGNEDGAQYAAM